jgi:ketosteroid isomerase-like protein
MINHLRINQLSQNASHWYLERYLPALDALDLEGYAAFLADDVAMQFNNEDPIVGTAAVLGMLGGYWKSFKALEHELLNIYGSDHAFMLEALNHYVRHDGKRVTTRAIALTDRNAEGRVTAIRVYADASPVFA